MRNFVREELEAANPHWNLDASEFSWSPSRHHLFRTCQRGYFFHYYLAQGGWNEHSWELAVAAFRAKHTLLFTEWLSMLFNRSLEKTLLRLGGAPAVLRSRIFRNRFVPILSAEVFQTVSTLQRTSEDSENGLRIRDLTASPEDLPSLVKDFAPDVIETLCESAELPLLIQAQSPGKSLASSQSSFLFENTEIWMYPGLQWLEKEVRKSFRIQLEPKTSGYFQCAADWFAFRNRETLHDEIPSLSFFLTGNGSTGWHVERYSGNPARGMELLRTGIKRMKAKILPDRTVFFHDFAECEDPVVCADCKYSEVCAAFRQFCSEAGF